MTALPKTIIIESLSLEDLKQFQEDQIESAKAFMMEEGRVPSFLFLVTTMSSIPEKFKEHLKVLSEDDTIKQLGDVPEDRPIFVTFDMDTYWKNLYHMMMHVPGKHRAVLPMLVKAGEDANVDDPYMRVMRPFLEISKLHPKDVQALFMRQMILEVGAYAFVKLDEAYIVDRALKEGETADDVTGEGSIKNHPDSKECIMVFLETHKYQRMVTIPFTRAGPEEDDKVTGFLEPKIIEIGADEHSLKGRFVNMLRPLPEEEKTKWN